MTGLRIASDQGGTGDGGNIRIFTPIAVGIDDSDIVANAFEGNGGNINIPTQGIWGYTFREQLTAESDITASSEFGIRGTVEINNLSIDPDSGLVALDEGIADTSNQVAKSCSDAGHNEFMVTGRGSMPVNPAQTVGGARVWSDVRDLAARAQTSSTQTSSTQTSLTPDSNTTITTSTSSTLDMTDTTESEISVEATSWRSHPSGQTELVASLPNQQALLSHDSCAASFNS